MTIKDKILSIFISLVCFSISRDIFITKGFTVKGVEYSFGEWYYLFGTIFGILGIFFLLHTVIIKKNQK